MTTTFDEQVHGLEQLGQRGAAEFLSRFMHWDKMNIRVHGTSLFYELRYTIRFEMYHNRNFNQPNAPQMCWLVKGKPKPLHWTDDYEERGPMECARTMFEVVPQHIESFVYTFIGTRDDFQAVLKLAKKIALERLHKGIESHMIQEGPYNG